LRTAQQERGSYCEISVSRTGLHIFKRSSKVFDGIKKAVNETEALEVYSHSRYFTVSGWAVPS